MLSIHQYRRHVVFRVVALQLLMATATALPVMTLYIDTKEVTDSSRRSIIQTTQQQRQPYHRITALGDPNVDVAIGNPLKGLAGGPRYSQISPLPNSVPSSIEFYNVGLDEIMIGANAFNWTIHDKLLEDSASRKMHAVISVYIHWPGRELRLPPHLRDLPLYDTQSGGKSPNYGDARLLTALEQFITAWGNRIDGDTRIATIHIGLLGFWGEGHTYPDATLVPESSKIAVAQWYRQSFTKTQIQARYPGPNAVGFGLYDGSLGYSTLDGIANGGKNMSWFTYRQMQNAEQTELWKQKMMGGETRPELQKIIFTDAYPSRTEYHQDYKDCIDTLHLSYVLHHDAFQNGGYTGNMLQQANKIHAYMGYAFYVSEVATYPSIALTTTQAIDIDVEVTQFGVAPFYYDLNLVLACGNGIVTTKLPGVNTIIAKGESKTFTFLNIPATTECLEKISLSLESSYSYFGRPIVFAQGTDGKVTFSLPLPPVVVPVATSAPVQLPVVTPLQAPVVVPAPIRVPALVPLPTRVAVVPALVSVPVIAPAPIPVSQRAPSRVPTRRPVPVPIIRPSVGGSNKPPVLQRVFKLLFRQLRINDK